MSGKEDHVCLLKQSLYGTKQAPRLWNAKFDEAIRNFGLTSSPADKCVYYRRTDDDITIAIIHVDDAIVASNKKEVLVKFEEHLGNKFQLRTLPLTRFLGVNISRDRQSRQIFLSQKHTILKLAERFNMEGCHP